MYQQTPSINIWQQALKQRSQQFTLSSSQKTIIVLGSSQSGKSSFIKLLKTDSLLQIKPTILFQYSYIKKQSLNKQIIHCYQLSNKNQQQIIPSFLNKQNFNKTKVIICIDLSKGANVLSEIKQWIQIVRTQLSIACRQKMTVQQKSKQFINQSLKLIEGQQDSNLIKPMPIQTIIIGCKYDELEKQDSENRKWLSRALRYFAHLNNCHLFYSSLNNPNLVSQIRNALNQILFSNKRTFYSQKDHLKPLFISKGQDSIDSLNIHASSSSNINIGDIIKKQMGALFGVDEDVSKKGQGGTEVSKYSQERVDNLIEERKKVLLKITKGGRMGGDVKRK